MNRGQGDCWILAAEKLPPDNEKVWCYDARDAEVIIGYHNYYGWSHFYVNDNGIGRSNLYDVTHWQPLSRPEPPIRMIRD